jgi:predicted NAD/FAD-dependent oxidoreductase
MNNKFTISTNEEQLDEAEAVIVTVPVPQVLTQLKGSIAQLIDDNKEIKDKLAQVKYSSRFAVGLFYPSSVTNLNIPWRIYYVDKKDNEYLRFLAVDNAKRNKS